MARRTSAGVTKAVYGARAKRSDETAEAAAANAAGDRVNMAVAIAENLDSVMSSLVGPDADTVFVRGIPVPVGDMTMIEQVMFSAWLADVRYGATRRESEEGDHDMLFSSAVPVGLPRGECEPDPRGASALHRGRAAK